MASSQEDTSKPLTPPEIVEKFLKAKAMLLPPASKEKYDRVYQDFFQWQKQNETDSFSEWTVLAFLSEKQKSVVPSTLWGISSMLKSTLFAYQNIDLTKYPTVVPFLKRNSVGYKPKKAMIFQHKDIDRFLLEAPDDDFLMKKVSFLLIFYFLIFFQVATIFGVAGACRREELTHLEARDVTFAEQHVMVSIHETKNYKPCAFAIIPLPGAKIDLIAII